QRFGMLNSAPSTLFSLARCESGIICESFLSADVDERIAGRTNFNGFANNLVFANYAQHFELQLHRCQSDRSSRMEIDQAGALEHRQSQ
ncbi:MAG TPA: hypothetical protein VFX22_07945, partial [Candidatus Kapabacteria bacterium]|nr:hypothetical protein [Candidatus Kapabacteria bacterium]